MKELVTLVVGGALPASVFFGVVYSEVSKQVTRVSALTEQAVPHE